MPPKKRAAPKKKAEPKKNIVADPKTGECPICFENFDNDYAELKCKHYYCYNCISNWSEKENTCPVCKGRFSYLHRIQKNAETNEFSKTKITVKKKSQADAIYQARQHTGAVIPPYRLLSILSYSTLNMLQYNSLHHYDEDDDEDEDYFPNPDLSHEMDVEEEEEDDFEWIRNVSRRINEDDDEEEDVNIFSHFHSLLGDLMPERRGTSENPISLIDEEVEGEDSNHMSGGSSSSGYRSSSNSSSNAQPIVIDLTDDQVQSDIRDISNEEEPADPVPSSSSSTIIPSEQPENQKTIGSKRRRRFVPEHEVAAEEVEGGYTARRNRSSSSRRVEISSDDIIEEIEL